MQDEALEKELSITDRYFINEFYIKKKFRSYIDNNFFLIFLDLQRNRFVCLKMKLVAGKF